MSYIKEIEIKNFRGFKELKIENFGQINLILGRNNCGKTTLLEGLFLTIGISNPLLLENINKLRGIGYKSADDFKFLFHKLRFADIPSFKMKFEDKSERTLELHPRYLLDSKTDSLKNNSDSNFLLSNVSMAATLIEGIDLKFGIKEKHSKLRSFISSFVDSKQGITFNQAKGYQEKLFAVYNSSDNKETNALPRYSEIIKRKKETVVLEAIKKFEPKIKAIFALPDGLYFDHEDFEERIPSNLAGDGVRRFLNIITTVAERNESIILIDEIENGLHYSAHKLLWKNLLSICKEMNIQLFISTHSLETIQHFKETLELDEFTEMREKSKIFSIIHTIKQGIKALNYSYESFKDAIELNNEIRN